MCTLVDLKTNFGDTVQVAEIKKTSLENIIEAAEDCDKIDEIILFGSSLQERCHESSDIHIAIVSNVKRAKLFNSKAYRNFTKQVYLFKMGQDYDILHFNSISEIKNSSDAVCFDIEREGKVIYRRK